ncbi:MAG TPA: hypothetical protein VKT99_08735 [Xanthobacteraceae bacterium]|jgi:hypothetical protein|nr:hypothetical protein [Xanthobacteraceae bacterium]
MALTNAEKQRRWRERRKALAKQAQEHQAAKVTSLRNDGDDSQKIQQAYEATEHARAHWVRHLLDLVEAYADARKKFASDKDFAHWLVRNEVDHFGSPDWLALINMASDPERTKIILSELKGMSPSGIWAEMEARRLVTRQ